MQKFQKLHFFIFFQKPPEKVSSQMVLTFFFNASSFAENDLKKSKIGQIMDY
jgi:hypothetical protein